MLIKKIISKKAKGEANFISGLIVTTMLVIFVFATANMYGDLTRAADIRSACRGYLYTMETNGYLTDANRQLLTSELEALGCKNIVFDGTTTAQVSYGNLVTLYVQCDIPVSVFNLNKMTGQNGMQNVTIVRRTIAKN